MYCPGGRVYSRLLPSDPSPGTERFVRCGLDQSEPFPILEARASPSFLPTQPSRPPEGFRPLPAAVLLHCKICRESGSRTEAMSSLDIFGPVIMRILRLHLCCRIDQMMTVCDSHVTHTCIDAYRSKMPPVWQSNMSSNSLAAHHSCKRTTSDDTFIEATWSQSVTPWVSYGGAFVPKSLHQSAASRATHEIVGHESRQRLRPWLPPVPPFRFPPIDVRLARRRRHRPVDGCEKIERSNGQCVHGRRRRLSMRDDRRNGEHDEGNAPRCSGWRRRRGRRHCRGFPSVPRAEARGAKQALPIAVNGLPTTVFLKLKNP